MPTDLPESLAESWRSLGTKTGETSVMIASITAETTVYEPIERADSLESIGASEIPVRSLFAVDVTISPSLSDLGMSPDAVFSKAAPKAKSQFVDTLEDEGLVVEHTREELEFEAANGNAGSWFVLDASYPVAADPADGTDRIDAEAHIAVWPLERSFGMAGGTLPLEDVPLDDGSAIADGTEPAEPLAVDPERDREVIAELVETIEFGDAADATE